MAQPPVPPPSPSVFDGFEHSPSWRIFRIMAEFVDGFTFLARVRRSVTFFGSARQREGEPYYEAARTLARRLAEAGYSIVTGGGPGIMQAANQGAVEGDGESVGINIQLPHEQRINPYVRDGISFHYFFSRKVMLDFSAEAYVFFPGGFGTLDEFFELINLAQTGKLERFVPILLIGRDYWQPLISWMETTLRDRLATIAPADLELWKLTDDLDEAVAIIEAGVETQANERFARTGTAQPTPDEKLRMATTPMAGTEQ
jgi:uncharacterized protein (TIGR00730 family)